MGLRKNKLSVAECEAVLGQNIIGTLSLCRDGQPYAIQLEYLYREGTFYMGTYPTGRKIDYLEANDRAVFTVFRDRHSHPEMLRQGIRCYSVMAEGRVATVKLKEVATREGEKATFRLLKLTVDSLGSWQCTRKICSQAAGIDNRRILNQWVAETEAIE